MYSVRDVATGLVVAHVGEITLTSVLFKVSEAGRQRVLREKRKNVHAGLEGNPVDPRAISSRPLRSATYDPYHYASFVDRETVEPLPGALFATIGASGVHYSQD